MKPDGGTMETTEPTEAAALVESTSLQENVTEEAPRQPKVETETAPNAKDDPPAAEPKVTSKTDQSKIQCTASASRVHVETASHRTVNDKFSAAAAGGRKATASKASAAGAVPKRPASAAAVSSTARNQTKMLDKRPTGPAKTTSTASVTVTNGTRPKTVNGPSKRPAAEAVNGARPKTTSEFVMSKDYLKCVENQTSHDPFCLCFLYEATANKMASFPAPKHGTAATRPGAASSKATRYGCCSLCTKTYRSNNTLCLSFKLIEFYFLSNKQRRQFSIVVVGPFESDCFIMSHILRMIHKSLVELVILKNQRFVPDRPPWQKPDLPPQGR